MALAFHKAKFNRSYSSVFQVIDDGIPQFAFIGRSNVGKSSLINAIVSRKDLAKTSSKPGKTQLINSFDVEGQIYLIDLPGYGYAKVSKSSRELFEGLITDYVLKSETLFVLFVLIDGSIPPQQIDLDFLNWCGLHEVPVAIVFTKTDKKKGKLAKINVGLFEEALLQSWDEMPKYFLSSATHKDGIEEMQKWISASLNP